MRLGGCCVSRETCREAVRSPRVGRRRGHKGEVMVGSGGREDATLRPWLGGVPEEGKVTVGGGMRECGV